MNKAWNSMLYSSIEMVQRAALLICGVVTVLIGRVYGGVRQFAPERGMAWLSFSYALLLVGIIAVGISLMPRKWAQGITERPSELRRFTAFRFLVCFAALGMILVALFSVVPPGLAQPSMGLVYPLCPACVVSVTVDPSLTTTLFLLAPLNALVFGAVGGVFGTAFSTLSR
jgi:hypothetical protein